MSGTLKTISLIALLTVLAGTAVLMAAASDSSDAAVGDTATVRFEREQGSSEYEIYYVRVGQTIELPTQLYTSDDGYLSGWNDGSTSYAPGADYTVTGDTRFVGEWATIAYDDAVHLEDVVLEPGEYYTVTFRDLASDYSGTITSVLQTPDWLEKLDVTGSTTTYGGMTLQPGVYVCVFDRSWLGYNPTYFWFTITVPGQMDETILVSYDMDGGSGSMDSVRVVSGTGLVLPGQDATSWPNDTMSLVGWYITDEYGNRGLYPLDSLYIFDTDTTVTAAWDGSPNVLVYSLDGGSLENVYATVTWTDEPVSLRTDAVKDGYTFLGWQVTQDRELVYAPGLLVDLTETTYLEAYFVPDGTDVVTVTFDAGLGHSAILSQSVEAGKYIYLPQYQVQYDGYTFLGWSTEPPTGDGVDDREYIQTEHLLVTEDITLYAVYHDPNSSSEPDTDPEPDPVTYTVIFDPNGGDATFPIQFVSDGDTAYDPGIPMRDGMLFLGWALLGTTEPWDFSQPVTFDMNLYAMWDQAFTISYSYTDDGLPVVTVDIDPTYVGSERIDVYWGSSRDGSETIYNGTASHTYAYTTWGYIVVTFTINGAEHTSRMPFSVTAEHYNPAREYTVSFDSNGGTSVPTQVITAGGYVTRPADPTRSGYVFVGWYFEGSEYDFSQPVYMDMTLVARWSDSPVVDPDDQDRTVAYFTITENSEGWLLDGSSSLNAEFYEWYLDGLVVGNGTTHVIYADELGTGIHTVQLMVTGPDGTEVWSSVQNITVGSSEIQPVQPTARFTIAENSDGWLLDASSSVNATRYVWYLDGELIAGESGSQVQLYADDLQPGTHTVMLVVFSNTENSDSFSDEIFVESKNEDPEDPEDDTDILVIVLVIVVIAVIALAVWRWFG